MLCEPVESLQIHHPQDKKMNVPLWTFTGIPPPYLPLLSLGLGPHSVISLV